MKQRSLVSYGPLGILVVALIIGLATPREHSIRHEVLIEASPARVYEKVSDLSTWPSWSPWKEMDPSLRFSPCAGRQAGKGASRAWFSRRAGHGNVYIAEAEPGRRISTEVRFGKKGIARGHWTFQSASAGRTRAIWTLKARFPFYYNARPLLMGLRPDNRGLGHGLQLLKAEVETAPPIQNRTSWK